MMAIPHSVRGKMVVVSRHPPGYTQRPPHPPISHRHPSRPCLPADRGPASSTRATYVSSSEAVWTQPETAGKRQNPQVVVTVLARSRPQPTARATPRAFLCPTGTAAARLATSRSTLLEEERERQNPTRPSIPLPLPPRGSTSLVPRAASDRQQQHPRWPGGTAAAARFRRSLKGRDIHI